MIKAYKLNLNVNFFHQWFVLQNVVDFIDRLLKVKITGIFDKVFAVLIQNGIVKNVMDEKIYELTGGLHLEAALVKTFVNWLKFLFDDWLVHLIKYLLKISKKVFHGTNLSDQRVERIP